MIIGRRCILLLLALLLQMSRVAAADTAAAATNNVDLRREVDIMNDSGHKLQVYWVRPQTGEAVRFADIQSGSKTVVNSFVNHTFMIREVVSDDDSNNSDDETENALLCDDNDGENCHVNYITVTQGDKPQIVHVKDGLDIEYEGDAVMDDADDDQGSKIVVAKCKEMAAARLAASANVDAAAQVFEDMASCVGTNLARLLEEKNVQLAMEERDRRDMADRLENYTCADNSLPTTPPKEVRTWEYNGTTHDVYVLHERKASQIHVLSDFISPDECDAIERAAQPKLHRGTVADGAGGHRLSEHRKAFQAGLKVDWDKEKDGDPIARVVRRLYDYTNHATGYNLSVVGQEDLMSIQYFGNGENDPTPDQYRPHCDGDCDGKPHKTGGRVATMVMYCTVPDKGGYTNFGQAGVIAKPKVGAAAFFSYMDPETMTKDTGFTTHSGCPVIEGTKRIAVQWMRVGVDAENPWDSFNTLTIKKDDAEDC